MLKEGCKPALGAYTGNWIDWYEAATMLIWLLKMVSWASVAGR